MSETLEAAFQRDGDVFLPGPHTAGPWDPGLMHGGAPASLFAFTAEQAPASAPLELARLTIDLMRPCPTEPARVEHQIVREGRNIQVLALTLTIGGKDCARATALRVRTADIGAGPILPRIDIPSPEACKPLSGFGATSFGGNFELRNAKGAWGEHGPAAIWYRLKRPLIAGAPTSPAMRAAAVADFGNGASSILDFNRYTYINADLTIDFARQPRGEWILLDAETWVGDAGRGFASSRLGDADGYFGRGLQNLVLSKR